MLLSLLYTFFIEKSIALKRSYQRSSVKAIPHDHCASDAGISYADTVNLFVRLAKRGAVLPAQIKPNFADMTEKLQANDVQRRQPVVVRCCLNLYLFSHL